MIETLRGKMAKDIVKKGGTKKFSADLNKRATLLLQALDSASSFDDIKKLCRPPSLKVHKLEGDMKEFWPITIKKPWCIIFRYKKGVFADVEIGDYHD